MKEEVERFLDKHIKACERLLKERGDFNPFIVFKRGEQLAIVPCGVTEELRPDFWVKLTKEVFEPEWLIFTGTAWATKVEKENETVRERYEVLFILAWTREGEKKVIIYRILREEEPRLVIEETEGKFSGRLWDAL